MKAVYQTTPRIRSLTPKHAHFAIDFYGKLCADRKKAEAFFKGIIEVWSRQPVNDVLSNHANAFSGLPGYDPEYVLQALNWILDQEDVNFSGRPTQKQTELDQTLQKASVTVPKERKGSQLAISLFCNILLGVHPVEAFIRASLDVLPVKRSFGAV